MTTHTNSVWKMVESYGTTYAQCGTYSHSRLLNKPECARCGRGAKYELFPKPLTLVWEIGSDLVGDFSWPIGRVAVTTTVFDALARHFSGVSSGTVEMAQEPELKRPKRITKRTKPRVWLPYEGPPLVEMCVERLVPFLPKTTIVTWGYCEDCGRAMRELGGIEKLHSRWNPQTMDLDRVQTPRVPGQGVFVRRSDLGGAQLFRIEEFYLMILCTDEVKAFIEERGFTNIGFLEYGNIVD